MINDWDGLEEAVAVADAGSFKGAARLLNVSTSHISKVIARLEARLELQLFNRTTRRVTLTDMGHSFTELSRRIIRERDELLASVNGSGEPQGELKITCSISLGERFLEPIVREFLSRHPRISVTLDLNNRLVDLVGEGYDLAIRTSRISDPRLTGRQVASRRIATVASPAYLAERGEPFTVDALTGHDCLIGTSSTWHFLENGEVRHFVPEGRWRCNSGKSVAKAAAAGLGICQLPLFYLRMHLAAGRLQPVLMNACPDPEPIWLVYPKRRHLLSNVFSLADLIEARLQDAIDRACDLGTAAGGDSSAVPLA